jgi:cytochrome c biogenesis protein CcdA
VSANDRRRRDTESVPGSPSSAAFGAVAIRIGHEDRNASQAAEPVVTVTVAEPPGRIGTRDLHAADGIGDGAREGRAHLDLEQLDRLSHVPQLEATEVDDRNAHPTRGLSDLGGGEDLPPMRLPSHPGGEVDPGAEVVTPSLDGAAVMKASAGNREVGSRQLGEQPANPGHSSGRVGEGQHDGVTDRLHEPVLGAQDVLGHRHEPVEHRDGIGVAVGLGQRREAGEIHERKGGVDRLSSRLFRHRQADDGGSRTAVPRWSPEWCRCHRAARLASPCRCEGGSTPFLRRSGRARPRSRSAAGAITIAPPCRARHIDPHPSWRTREPNVLDAIIERLDGSAGWAPLVGLLVGVSLGLSPISLPSVPAAMAVVSPGVLAGGERHRLPLTRSAPVMIAFVAGMDGVIGMVGFAIVEVGEFLTRASLILHLVAAVMLGTAGVLMLTRNASLCRMAASIPRRPGDAFLFGVFFAVGGCPACGPVALSVGAASALAGGPLLGLAAVGAFVLGRAAVLLAAGYLGARLLPEGADVQWSRLDRVVGILFLFAAAFYLYRILSGQVVTSLPGEPGGGLA